MRSRERPVGSVPAAIRLMLAGALALQIGWHAWRPDPGAEAGALAPAPPASSLRIAALGDEAVLAKLLLLRLLAHDNQPGMRIPYLRLDYGRVSGWLDAILDLDPRADSPLLAAARLYGSVPDPHRQRVMFELVYRRFHEDPDRRWPWLAHAAVMAKHRLDDPALALRYARAVTEHALGPHVPPWVRDMSALIATDMGELEAARILIGGLLHSGRVSDPREIRFLAARLAEIEARSTGLDSGTARDGHVGSSSASTDGSTHCAEHYGFGSSSTAYPALMSSRCLDRGRWVAAPRRTSVTNGHPRRELSPRVRAVNRGGGLRTACALPDSGWTWNR